MSQEKPQVSNDPIPNAFTLFYTHKTNNATRYLHIEVILPKFLLTLIVGLLVAASLLYFPQTHHKLSVSCRSPLCGAEYVTNTRA